MQLTLWTYEGPPHIGAMRVATAMRGLHYVLHAPQGDTYADLLFTMIERRGERPPVSYTTFEGRDLGSDTAELFKSATRQAYERFQPQAMIVGASCTGELIQDDPAGLAKTLGLPIPVIGLELSAYQKKENWGAAETFYQLVRHLSGPRRERAPEAARRANILGATALGFRHRDDLREISQPPAPSGRRHQRRGAARRDSGGPRPVGRRRVQRRPLSGDRAARRAMVGEAPRPAVHEDCAAWRRRDARLHCGCRKALPARGRRAPRRKSRRAPSGGRIRSISTYLTGKRVFIFGDATHAIAAARFAATELGFQVVGLGTYSREFARETREAAKLYGVEALITDDYLEVEGKIAELAPELVLGTQMERHVAKRLAIPCAVISAPAHVQDYPARFSPHMGVEGANVLFDACVHPLMMGLEEHLLTMFRGDAEFHEAAAPSHLGSRAALEPASPIVVNWTGDAEKELKKIPIFVRGKARRNTETFARERGLARITVETLYDAKAHYSR